MSGEYKPRFSFEITAEQQRRADKLLTTYGLRRSVFSIVLDDVLDLVEKHGQVVLGIILDGAAKPREIVPVLSKADKKGGP